MAKHIHQSLELSPPRSKLGFPLHDMTLLEKGGGGERFLLVSK